MYDGQYTNIARSRRKRRMHRLFLTVACVVLLVSIACGATLAIVIARTDRIDNQFEAGKVSCSVQDNRSVQNTGNVSAYIRAAIVVNWRNDNGDIRGIAPVAGTDYSVSLGEGWVQDGLYYYYTGSVDPNGFTYPVCTVMELKQAPGGYTLVLDLVSEAIQADGDTEADGIDAVLDAWLIAMGS